MRMFGRRITALLLTFILLIGLMPGMTMADSASGTVTVRIVGENSEVLNQTIDINTITDCTTDVNDTSLGLNALDAVISATQVTSPNAFDISYNTNLQHLLY